MKKNILAIMALTALVIPFGVYTPAVQLVQAQTTVPTGVSYIGNILDIPRLPAFGGNTSEGGSFIDGVLSIDGLEWMPGSDGAGYFVITTGVAQQLGPNARRFGLWVFSDEGEELAQVDIVKPTGDPLYQVDASHLPHLNEEVRIFGDDIVAMRTYWWEGNNTNGLYFFRIGGPTGVTILNNVSDSSAYLTSYYGDDYVIVSNEGSATATHTLRSAPSLEGIVTYPFDPFSTNNGSTVGINYPQVPSIGNYILFAHRTNGNNYIPAAYELTSSGLKNAQLDLSMYPFIWHKLQSEDWSTGGKWIVSDYEFDPRERKIVFLVPGENELVVKKEFSLDSGFFAETLVPNNKKRIVAISAIGKFLAVNVFDDDGTGSFETGYGTNRLFVFNYETEELLFSGVLDKHREGGPSFGIPHPTTGVPLQLYPDRIDKIFDSALAPNGMLAVQVGQDQIHLYKTEGVDGSGGGDGGTDPGDGGQTQQDAPSFEYLYQFTTLYMKLVQDLMRGSINLDTVRGLNSSTREPGTRDAVGGSGRGNDSINRIFDFLKF
jgi:hypothetical protein